MTALRTLSRRFSALTDSLGYLIADPTDLSVVGHGEPREPLKVVYALATNLQSGQTRRYIPSHNTNAGESVIYGMDFSAVLAPGVGIVSGTLRIAENVVPPKDATADWTIGPIRVIDRALYARLRGGVDGTDYLLTWTAVDTLNNTWPRVGLLLCARTS